MNRKEIIDHVLNDLRSLRNGGSFSNQYAVEENIRFFEACKSILAYIKWLIVYAPKIERERILELTDFPFPKWDQEMHGKLIEMEKKEFPGLVAPLVNKIYEFILSEKNRFIGVSLGCGGMEVERQVIKTLIEKKHQSQVILIGIDKSAVTYEVAKKNLQEVEPDIDIHEVEILDKQKLEKIIKNESNKHTIVMCKNDIFELQKYFDPKSFTLMYHSLFKHHLRDEQKQRMDLIMNVLSKKTLEYDGFKNWTVIIPQTIVGWNHPVFLNAEIFSNFRYFTRKELKGIYRKFKISFYTKLGTYLKYGTKNLL